VRLLRDLNRIIPVSYPVLAETDAPDLQLMGMSPRERFDAVKNGKKLVSWDGCMNQCTVKELGDK